MKYKAIIYVRRNIDFDIEAKDPVDAYQAAVAWADQEIMPFEEYEDWKIGEMYELKMVQFSRGNNE
jgi:hypothetical protein